MPTPRATMDQEKLDQEVKALELRRAGIDYRTIAERCQLSGPGQAHKLVKRALARIVAEPAADVRNLELDRLDRLQAAMWKEALNGNARAFDRVMRVLERRARMLGLDHADGLAERAVQLAEAQGQQVAQVIQAVLEQLELTAEQRERAPQIVVAELRRVAQLEAGRDDLPAGAVGSAGAGGEHHDDDVVDAELVDDDAAGGSPL